MQGRLYIVGLFSFFSSLVAVLLIFQGNKRHLADVLDGKDQSDPYLEKCDMVAIYAFAVGAIFAGAVGVTTAYSSYSEKTKKDDTMTKETKGNQGAVTGVAYDSVNGVGFLKKSFNNVSQLKPQTTGQSSSGSSSSQSSSQSSSSTEQKK